MKKMLESKLFQAALLLFCWVVVLNLFMFVATNRFNLLADSAYSWMNPDQFPAVHIGNIIEAHVRWDSVWYLDIAQNGYSYEAGQLSNIVFFPVYPLIVGVIGVVVGFPLAGWLVSIAALIGVVLLLVKYVEEHHKNIDARDVVFFLLIFPTAIFLNAVYTESIFLLLTIATFYFGLKRQFLIASLIGMVAALTRVTGMLLVVPLFIEYIVAMQKEGKKVEADVLALALIPFGAGLFFLYHWIQFGSPFLFFEVQSSWGRGFELNAEHFLTSTLPQQMNLFLDVFFVIFVSVATLLVALRLRLSYAVYMFLGFIVPIITGTLMSIGRYVLVLFPIYLLAATIKHPIVKQSWILISVLLFALYTILFGANYWAG